VATPGKPTRLTDSPAGVTRLIGKPGVVPTMHLGSPREEATARAQPLRVVEPILVCGRHRVWRSTDATGNGRSDTQEQGTIRQGGELR